MTTLGEIRASGVITMYGSQQYKADRLDLCDLCHEVKRQEVHHEPVPVVDDEGNAVGSIFPHREFPIVPRLVLVIGRDEYHIRTECFMRTMSEGQMAAQIITAREEVLPEGQATLGCFA